VRLSGGSYGSKSARLMVVRMSLDAPHDLPPSTVTVGASSSAFTLMETVASLESAVPSFTVSRGCATLINLGHQVPVEG
jgi:hypothetical protein